MTKRWYVVHAYSGMEKSVARALQDRVERSGMQEQFGKILVPTEEVVEMKNGQRTISERRFFPGYVLVEMDMNDDTWHLVKNTNKVTGFVGGSGHKPTPISEKEVDKIMSQMQEGVEKPRPKDTLRGGRDGPRQGGSVHRLQRQCRGSQLRKKPPCASRSRFSGVPRPLNWSLVRSKNSESWPIGRLACGSTGVRRSSVSGGAAGVPVRFGGP